MHPGDFMKQWGVTRAELACLLNKKINTVDHWLSKTPQAPPNDVLLRLDEIHARFSQWELEDSMIPHIRQLYETSKDRRSKPTEHRFT